MSIRKSTEDKIRRLVISLGALWRRFTESLLALQTLLACDENSLSVVNQPGLKERISRALNNGAITLSGGTKTAMGQRWVFDKPVTLETPKTPKPSGLAAAVRYGQNVLWPCFYFDDASPRKALRTSEKAGVGKRRLG